MVGDGPLIDIRRVERINDDSFDPTSSTRDFISYGNNPVAGDCNGAVLMSVLVRSTE